MDANTATALELHLVDRLSAAFNGLSVELYPDQPDSFQLLHPIGALLVRYAGSQYGVTQDTDIVIQPRTLIIEITLVMRSLHGKDGITDTLESVRRVLTGYAPPAFGRRVPVKDEFLGEYGGEWHYAMQLHTRTVAMQPAEPDAAPLLTHLTVHDDTDQTDIRKHPDGTITTDITARQP